MTKSMETPDFRDEAEEAQWWAEHESTVLSEFRGAAQDGTLKQGTLMKRGPTPPVTIRLDPSDLELARSQAERLGLRYQTYIKMILHQALTTEADRQDSRS